MLLPNIIFSPFHVCNYSHKWEILYEVEYDVNLKIKSNVVTYFTNAFLKLTVTKIRQLLLYVGAQSWFSMAPELTYFNHWPLDR